MGQLDDKLSSGEKKSADRIGCCCCGGPLLGVLILSVFGAFAGHKNTQTDASSIPSPATPAPVASGQAQLLQVHIENKSRASDGATTQVVYIDWKNTSNSTIYMLYARVVFSNENGVVDEISPIAVCCNTSVAPGATQIGTPEDGIFCGIYPDKGPATHATVELTKVGTTPF